MTGWQKQRLQGRNRVQDKLIELETKFSFQEDLLQQLNEVVIRQQRQLDEMSRDMRVLKDQLGEVAADDSKPGAAEQQNERPPHY